QRTEGPRARGLEPSEPLVAVEILREIVDPHEVETVDAEALQALLDRSQRAVLRVVVDDAVGPAGREDEALFTEVAGLRLDLVQDQSADLGAEDVVVTPVPGERLAQTRLGKAGAVERRRVEIARAIPPGGFDGRERLLFGNVAKHVAERRCT